MALERFRNEVRSRPRYDSTNIKKKRLEIIFSGASGKRGKAFCVDAYDYSRLLNILSKNSYNMLCYSISFCSSVYVLMFWLCPFHVYSFLHKPFMHCLHSTLCTTQALTTVLQRALYTITVGCRLLGNTLAVEIRRYISCLFISKASWLVPSASNIW